MHRHWFWCAASLWLGGAGGASAASVQERSIRFDIRPDGSVLERTRLSVRLDSAADQEAWSTYAVRVDENRTLESLTASVVKPGGARLPIKIADTLRPPRAGILHDSQRFHVLRLPEVSPASVLTIDHAVVERPYFASDWIPLGGEEPIERLEIEVAGAGPGWRWRIDGHLPGLRVEERPAGLLVRGEGLPAVEPAARAPRDSVYGAVLRFAWGAERGWPDVGSWFEGLLREVPRNPRLAERVAADAAGEGLAREEQIAALLDFVRQKVRYVAVEVGIGGFRPFPPEKVLERTWGDCKDKALLLLDLLAARRIEAYPALVLSSDDGRVDADFPSPSQFNHVIVAIPVPDERPGDDLPVSDRFLFVDPTQTSAGLRWLDPGVQGQHALVVRGERSVLARTPIRPRLEGHRVFVSVDLDVEGNARGETRIELHGRPAAQFLDAASGARPEAVEHRVREEIGRYAPGGRLDAIAWRRVTADPPAAVLSASVRFFGLSGKNASSGFVIPGPSATPSLSLLEDRTLPLALEPGVQKLLWRVALPPDACASETKERLLRNEIGGVRHAVKLEDRILLVEREVEIEERWVEPSGVPALRQLAVEEGLARRRRVRLGCASEGSFVSSTGASIVD
jgi:hypothetical protein